VAQNGTENMMTDSGFLNSLTTLFALPQVCHLSI